MGVKDVSTDSPAEFLMWRASDLLRQGKWLHAVQVYSQILDRFPEVTDAAVQLASIYAHHNQHDQAQSVLQTALAAHPDDLSLLMQLGNLALQSNAEGVAADYFGRAKILDPGHSGIRFGLGLAFNRMGRTEDAAEVLEELYAERPDHRGVREVLADIYVCGGRADEAMALLIEAEALDPDNAGIHHLKGVIFSGRKLWRDAIVSLRRARTLQPGSLDVGRALSMALLNGGAPKEGRKMLEQLASAVPLSQQVQLDLAVAEAITGDTEKALNRIDHLESGEPGDQPTISRMVEVRRIIDKLAKQSNDGSGNGVDHQD